MDYNNHGSGMNTRIISSHHEPDPEFSQFPCSIAAYGMGNAVGEDE
jgi:hypothetical protein